MVGREHHPSTVILLLRAVCHPLGFHCQGQGRFHPPCPQQQRIGINKERVEELEACLCRVPCSVLPLNSFTSDVLNFHCCIGLHYFSIWYHYFKSLVFLSWNLACFSSRCQNSADALGKSLANLQKDFNDLLAAARREKDKAWASQRQLQEEVVSQQEKLEEIQAKYRQACIKSTAARLR